ncbi:hypothetical protein CMUST_10570 [Corynebacterium mustelae]|uniref:DNA-binding protein n=1 Tax=Corynebacterium mustelae TaxID=571915 RepID=A0A0G3H0Z3_9CORY|nr:hypothetical protein [Corynebacterium mustelae]AKK06430.1 hypothetical protein CMUST_10570 [Corynebacterium mustelae]
MIHINPTPKTHDVSLAAVSYSSDLGLAPIVRLIPEPLIIAETLGLKNLRLNETTHTLVGYTPKRAIGFPAWPILTDPGNAQHALNLVQDVEWARRKAKTEAGAVKKRIDQLTGVLQASAPHFLPTFLEEIARIFVEAENLPYAKQYFGKARDVERTHSLTVDAERHAQAFAEFAALGVVSAKAFSQEARDAATRMQPQEAYDYFFALLIDQAKSGSTIYANAFKDLQFLGKNAGKSATDVEQELVAAYIPTRSFPKSPASVLKKIVAVMPGLLETRPESSEYFYTSIPEKWDVVEYVTTLKKLNLWEPLHTNPEKFVPWIEALVAHANSAWRYITASDPDLLDAIVANKDALAGLPLLVEASQYHLDYLDAFSAVGMKWKLKPSQYSWRPSFQYDGWFKVHHRDLEFLLRREDLRDQLVADLPPASLEEDCTALLEAEPTQKLVGWKLETYRKLRENATGSMEEWRTLTHHTQHINDPRIRELYPDLVAELLHIDPAYELAERLRRGTIAEYTWPTFEKTVSAMAEDDITISATYPWVCLRAEKDLRVISGDVVRTYRLPSMMYAQMIPTDDDVLAIYYDSSSHENKWLWLNEGTSYTIEETFYSSHCADYISTIDGTLYVGTIPIREGNLKSLPVGNHVGFGPVYADKNAQIVVLPSGEKISSEDFRKQLTQGTLPGIDLPDVSAVAAENGAEFSFNNSFTTTTTDATLHSPFGVDSDRTYGISLEKDSEKYWYISPLGTFVSDEKFFAVRKPQADVWYLRKDWRTGHVLYDAATDTQIAPSRIHTGQDHPLSLLPPAAFHQLTVRNEKVSAKMRSCTTEQAAELIANPLSIVEFADNDSVLASAIAGIIADIGVIDTASVELPVLDTVPEELEHLYARFSPMEQSEESVIPLPPSRSESEIEESFIINMHQLASTLNNPQEAGEANVSHDCSQIVGTIGREKIWLTRLATPGAALEDVRFFCKLLHWCADYGVLGVWRRLNLTDGFYQDRWENKQLFVSLSNVVLWNPDISDRPNHVEKPHTFNDELFMPKAEFKQALDDILAWHEKRHAEGMGMVPAWGDGNVTEAAAQVAAVTTLTPQHWECLFAGVFDGPLTRYSAPMTWTSRITPEEASEVLSYTEREIASCIEHYHKNFGYYFQTFQGLAWHKDYLTDGPSAAAIGAAWEEMWGTPWIHLTNEMWDTLPTQLQNNVDHVFHGGIKTINGSINWCLSKVMPVYLNLVQFVEPSSTEAKNLAERILETTQCTVDDPQVPLGCEYTSKLFKKSEPNEHSLRLAKEGYLDSLLHYLNTGKAIEGIEEDPTISAPNIVADAAKTLGISANAARYFLQLLALTRPMDTHVKKWNGWTKVQLDQARQELVDKKLVVVAKRAGTGRKVFLPGGWLEKSTTGPAMEVWKAPHYLLWKDTKCRPIVETCPPLMPYPELFTEVWERYKTGDVPGYEELTTTRYRRKR